MKTSTSYKLTLRYQQSLPRLSWVLGSSLYTSPNAIAPFYEWQGEKLITSYENSRGKQFASVYLSPEVEVIPQWLDISSTVTYIAERTRGTDYTHYNHNWSWDATASLSHWNFSLIAQYRKALKGLNGESIDWDETLSLLMLGYNWKAFEFGAGIINPFNKYDRGSKSLNKYNTHEMHNRLDMNCIPIVKISYNLQWGRQKRGADKLVNTDASVDKSTSGKR